MAASPRAWLAATTAVGLAGGTLAVTQATHTDWRTVPSVSHFGIDPGVGAIMNITFLALGFCTLALGLSLGRRMAAVSCVGRIGRPYAARLLRVGFVIAGAALAVTGVFRIDGETSLAIHTFAGWTAPIAVMTTLTVARIEAGSLGRRFDTLAAVIIAGMLVLLAIAQRVIVLPYAPVELSCIGLMGAWLWLFEARLRRMIVAA